MKKQHNLVITILAIITLLFLDPTNIKAETQTL